MLTAPPFQISALMLNLVVEICEILQHLNLTHKHAFTPILRRKNLIKTVRASLGIENNSLDLEQVSAIIEGKRVLGRAKDIKEVQNAFAAYEQLLSFDALSIKHLLKAHALMMKGLIKDAGVFRSLNVGVFDKQSLIHLAPPAKLVPEQMRNLFKWYKNSDLHPLIKSSIFHYEFEFIHPFSDGNGRLGRMWQSKLLGEFNKIFYFLPVEELIIKTQKQYYESLSKSDQDGMSNVFVEYMLEVIQKALLKLKNGGTNGGLNGGTNSNEKAIIKALKNNKTLSNQALANTLNISLRSLERTLSNLVKKGLIKRVGANKNGYYEVIQSKSKK